MIRDTDSPAGARQKLVFEYDHQGRRIRKQFFTYSGGWQEQTVFLYDGWNLVTELNANASNARVRTYVWGSDLSGSMQGAGGVGGLLKLTYYGTSTTNAFVAYDGNGNVTALIDASNGNACARYEYGPFAEPIRSSGPLSKLNPIRFSTKYIDNESGFLYYGYRYYNPSTGRWPSRDPIEELGFRTQHRRQASSRVHNPYEFVRNSPIVLVDVLGLTEVTSTQPFCGATKNADGIYVLHVDDGEDGTVELNRITMAEVEAEKKRLVGILQGFKERDGCKSRKYEGGFDSRYFAGEGEQHQYYLVDGQCPIYADNEINYIGIGLYEAWLCDSLAKAKAIVWLWKVGKWHDTPSEGTMHWLEVGYNNYQKLKSANDSCCRCGGDTRSDSPGGRR